MLRLLHTADIHLGARHSDLGERAAAQRERQFAAFRRSVDVALEERVDLFLIAGDLFDSNTQPRRSVERVGAELRRLVQGAIGAGLAATAVATVVPGVAGPAAVQLVAVVRPESAPPLAQDDGDHTATIQELDQPPAATNPSAAPPNTWTVRPRDNFWVIARNTLASAWGRAPRPAGSRTIRRWRS